MWGDGNVQKKIIDFVRHHATAIWIGETSVVEFYIL